MRDGHAPARHARGEPQEVDAYTIAALRRSDSVVRVKGVAIEKMTKAQQVQGIIFEDLASCTYAIIKVFCERCSPGATATSRI